MKVFISWSGARSRAVAELLNDWIKCVLQAARPWVSTQNIDRGALWFSEIQTQLKDTSVGIICLTQENRAKPWILFEAGALAKGLSANRVCTFLVDLTATDVENPLAQFNHTIPDEDGMWELVRTLNNCLPPEHFLDERILERVFDTYFPQFREEFEKVVKETDLGVPAPKRDDADVLSEILSNTRALTVRLSDVEIELQRTRRAQRMTTGERVPIRERALAREHAIREMAALSQGDSEWRKYYVNNDGPLTEAEALAKYPYLDLGKAKGDSQE